MTDEMKILRGELSSTPELRPCPSNDVIRAGELNVYGEADNRDDH